MTSPSGSLEVCGLSLAISGRQVVTGVNLVAQPGEVLGVIGANGSGKSSLLKGLAGLLAPVAGSIALEGRLLAEVPLQERARAMAYLPQNPECHWPLSAERVVALGRLPFSESDAATSEAVGRALQAVDAVGLRGRSIWELSGGEQTRVFLARALVGEPRWLLVDEPGAGLDPYHQLQLMELLQAHAKKGGGVVVVLHDLGLAARFCHRLVALREGRVVAAGRPEEALAPAALAEVHRVEAFATEHEGATVLTPWRRL